MPMRPRSGSTAASPEEVVLELLGAGMLEAEDLAALRIDAGHHMLDGAVLARGVHRLEDDEQRVAVVRVQHGLPLAQLVGCAREQRLVVLLRLVVAA